MIGHIIRLCNIIQASSLDFFVLYIYSRFPASFDTKQKPKSSDDRLTLGSSGGLRSYNEKKLGPFTAYSPTSSLASMDRLDGRVSKDADGGMEASAAPAHEPESVPRSSCLKLKDNFVDFKMSSSSNDDSSVKSKFPSNNIELDYMTSAKDVIFAENVASVSTWLMCKWCGYLPDTKLTYFNQVLNETRTPGDVNEAVSSLFRLGEPGGVGIIFSLFLIMNVGVRLWVMWFHQLVNECPR